MQTQPQSSNPPPPPRKVLHTLLYLALLLASIFAAWQIHVWWVRPPRLAVQAPPDSLRLDPDAPEVASRPSRIAGPGDNLTGLADLKADPDNLPPPPSSRRLRGFGQTLGDIQRQLAKYESPGTVDEVGRYYIELLKARGYRMLGQRSVGTCTSLVFEQDPRQVSILLEKKVSQNGLVSIVLVLTSPATSGGQEAARERPQSAPSSMPG